MDKSQKFDIEGLAQYIHFSCLPGFLACVSVSTATIPGSTPAPVPVRRPPQ